MEIDAQKLINSLREQRNDALDEVAMLRAAQAAQQEQSEGDTSSGNT